MLSQSNWPRFANLSFEFEGQNVFLSFSEYRDVYQLHLSTLGKYGHVAEIIHPKLYKEFLPGTKLNIEYETKQLLGPDTVEFTNINC